MAVKKSGPKLIDLTGEQDPNIARNKFSRFMKNFPEHASPLEWDILFDYLKEVKHPSRDLEKEIKRLRWEEESDMLSVNLLRQVQYLLVCREVLARMVGRNLAKRLKCHGVEWPSEKLLPLCWDLAREAMRLVGRAICTTDKDKDKDDSAPSGAEEGTFNFTTAMDHLKTSIEYQAGDYSNVFVRMVKAAIDNRDITPCDLFLQYDYPDKNTGDIRCRPPDSNLRKALFSWSFLSGLFSRLEKVLKKADMEGLSRINTTLLEQAHSPAILKGYPDDRSPEKCAVSLALVEQWSNEDQDLRYSTFLDQLMDHYQSFPAGSAKDLGQAFTFALGLNPARSPKVVVRAKDGSPGRFWDPTWEVQVNRPLDGGELSRSGETRPQLMEVNFRKLSIPQGIRKWELVNVTISGRLPHFDNCSFRHCLFESGAVVPEHTFEQCQMDVSSYDALVQASGPNTPDCQVRPLHPLGPEDASAGIWVRSAGETVCLLPLSLRLLAACHQWRPEKLSGQVAAQAFGAEDQETLKQARWLLSEATGSAIGWAYRELPPPAQLYHVEPFESQARGEWVRRHDLWEPLLWISRQGKMMELLRAPVSDPEVPEDIVSFIDLTRWPLQVPEGLLEALAILLNAYQLKVHAPGQEEGSVLRLDPHLPGQAKGSTFLDEYLRVVCRLQAKASSVPLEVNPFELRRAPSPFQGWCRFEDRFRVVEYRQESNGLHGRLVEKSPASAELPLLLELRPDGYLVDSTAILEGKDQGRI